MEGINLVGTNSEEQKKKTHIANDELENAKASFFVDAASTSTGSIPTVFSSPVVDLSMK